MFEIAEDTNVPVDFLIWSGYFKLFCLGADPLHSSPSKLS